MRDAIEDGRLPSNRAEDGFAVLRPANSASALKPLPIASEL
jgi:hypothetical protein